MRIFKGNIDSLAFLSCCSRVDDPQSPNNAVTPHLNHQASTLVPPTNFPNKIRQVPSIECLQRTFLSKSRGREKPPRSTNTPSRSSSHCSQTRKIDSEYLYNPYEVPTTPKIPSPHPLNITSALTPSLTAPKTDSSVAPANSIPSSTKTSLEFKPLNLRISLTSTEWANATPFTMIEENDQNPKLSSDSPKSHSDAKNNSHTPTESSSARNMLTGSTEFFSGDSKDRLLFNSEFSQDLNRDSNNSSHSKNNSDSAIFERLQLALAEKSMLTERLRNIENDIVRKSAYFGDATNIHSMKNNGSFTDESEFSTSHPTQSNYSLPTVLRPRSYSLNSSSFRPKWGENQPPVPSIQNVFAHSKDDSKCNQPLQSRPSVSSARPYARREFLSSTTTLPDQGNPKSHMQGILKTSTDTNFKYSLPHPLQSSPPNSSTQSISNGEYLHSSSFQQERENGRPPLQGILKSSSYRTDNYSFHNSLKSSPAYPSARRSEDIRPATSGCLLPDHGSFIPPLPFILNNPAHQEDKAMSRVSSWLTVTSNHNKNNKTNPNFDSNEPSPVSHSDEFYQFAKPTHSITESSISTKDDFIYTPGGNSPVFHSEVSAYDETEYYHISLPNIDFNSKPPELMLNERANKRYFSPSQYSGIAL